MFRPLNRAIFRLCNRNINPSNAELNPICHLLVLLEAHHILHISRIRVNSPITQPEDGPIKGPKHVVVSLVLH
jgi:hypothetical protein